MNEPPVLVGIDVGGTYTDIVAMKGAEVFVTKVPSTPKNPEESVINALVLLHEMGWPAYDVVLGTTVGTNAVITRNGADVALLTTRGFRDLLEMRRRSRPRTYGLDGTFQPLVPRNRRLEVRERVRADGAVEVDVDPEEALAALATLPELPDSVAVSFLHSYRNPTNERVVGDALRSAGYRHVTLSHEVLGQIKEFERTSTTVVNAFLQPVMDRYLSTLSDCCQERNLARQLLILHSNGGAMTFDLAMRFPVRTVMSGPAGGVLAALQVGLATGHGNLLTCDMGGTSFDAALVVNGRVTQAQQMEIEFGIPITTSTIEVLTIGAGGGSIGSIDRGNFLQIGPQSAGADPGPACYGRGGERPTITDANVVLGRINSKCPIGDLGVDELDVEAARTAIQRDVGGPLGLTVEEAALAMIAIANQKMAGALRLISVERGHDPVDFSLVAFGGAGPLHVCALMYGTGLKTALIPPFPGITSAIGSVSADYRHDRVQSVSKPLSEVTDKWLHSQFAQETARVTQEAAESGIETERAAVELSCDAGYLGQAHLIHVPLGDSMPSVSGLLARFEEEYGRQFGGLLEELAVMITNVRVSIRVHRNVGVVQANFGESMSAEIPQESERRSVRFESGWHDTPIYQRSTLATGHTIEGPAVVEQADTTILLEPGYRAQVDGFENLVVTDGA